MDQKWEIKFWVKGQWRKEKEKNPSIKIGHFAVGSTGYGVMGYEAWGTRLKEKDSSRLFSLTHPHFNKLTGAGYGVWGQR